MATLVLQVAGSAIGSALGGPIGMAIGQAAGALAGGLIDRQIMGGGRRSVEGPRLKALDGITASEGAPIPRLYGRARLGGQVIWATRFEEQIEVTRQGRSGGKSGRSGQPATTTTSYYYYANLAVALCEGPIAMVRRVWADGKLLDLTTVTMRVHRGDETQLPDPLLVARQGAVPAYRGTAYVVFERLPLTAYGNRLPQLSFEVVRPVAGLADKLRGVVLIPGATEAGYQTALVSRALGQGATTAENRNQTTHATDMEASLDALEAICPACDSVALTSAWFGDDLRAGHCTIRPAVDLAAKITSGTLWSVAGVPRETARVTSRVDGRAAFGGTPSDASILAAIAELKGRGKSVVFYPFVMMDIAAGNSLPDPWSGDVGQPAYPWRGRITCHPAPGRAASPDGSAAAGGEVAAFFGSVQASHFTVAAGTVAYSGPAEWSYSRFVLHNAALCKAAGGVSAFLIGSELVGLTRVRDSATGYAATGYLKALAAEVRALLGPAVKIGYAADWSEYGAHVRNAGADVGFPLDPLWSDANIDFIGIDYYPPVADWRDGTGHLDAADTGSGHAASYLKSRLISGEAWDWYYASEADRAAQIRTPISDGAFGKPWTFRAKDLAGWWANSHRPRTGGVEGPATGWQPSSKPIWLTEVGCPAVDKGANAPNAFPDPKSSEGGYPPFSLRLRDDLIQARYLGAVLDHFDPAAHGFEAAHNPLSPVYGGRMVDPAHIHVWAWDARPYPAFPHLGTVWGDSANWALGHWLNGRIEGMPLDRLIAAIAADFGLPAPVVDTVDGFVDGYIIDRPMSARAALEPLEGLFGIDAAGKAAEVAFAARGRGAISALSRGDLVPDRKGGEIARTRAQESELPRQVSLAFTDAEAQYQPATAASRRLQTVSRRIEASDTTAVLRRAEAARLVEIALQDAWVGRETVEFSLRPGCLALEPGDLVRLPGDLAQRVFQITRIGDGAVRQCRARAIEPNVFDLRPARSDVPLWSAPPVAGPASAVVLALAVDPGDPVPLALLALRAQPWCGPYTVWISADGAAFAPAASVLRPAIMGTTLTDLAAGPLWRWDRGAGVTVELAGGALASRDAYGALGSDGLLAIQGSDGAWEILSHQSADLIGPGQWRLDRLLRGQHGSEATAASLKPAGSRVVVLDSALTALFEGAESLGATATVRISPADRDHADPAAIELTASASSAALLPLSPVGLKARRENSGIVLSWIRRTRRGGDNWDLAEVPLGEEAEAYTLDVLDGATLKRSFQPSTTSQIYTTAEELADFGTPRTSLTIRLSQMSRAAGAGAACAATVPVLSA